MVVVVHGGLSEKDFLAFDTLIRACEMAREVMREKEASSTSLNRVGEMVRIHESARLLLGASVRVRLATLSRVGTPEVRETKVRYPAVLSRA